MRAAESRITPTCSRQWGMYAHLSWARRTAGSARHHVPAARWKPADEAGRRIARATAADGTRGAVPQVGLSTPVRPVWTSVSWVPFARITNRSLQQKFG